MQIIEFIIISLATVKYMMILESLQIPLKILGIIKETESDWLRLVLAKAGMFFDCPVCLSVLSAIIAIVLNSLNHIFNLLFAISVLGLFLKKEMIDR